MKYAAGSCPLYVLKERSSSVCIAPNKGEGLPTGGASGGPACAGVGRSAAPATKINAGTVVPAKIRFNLRKGVPHGSNGCTRPKSQCTSLIGGLTTRRLAGPNKRFDGFSGLFVATFSGGRVSPPLPKARRPALHSLVVRRMEACLLFFLG